MFLVLFWFCSDAESSAAESAQNAQAEHVQTGGVQCAQETPGTAVRHAPTPREHALLPCGHLDFESAVIPHNDEFKF